MNWKWKNFTPEEVLSPSGMAQLSRGNFLLQPHALDKLQKLRDYVGTPLIVNVGEHVHRGYRSAEENAKISGAKFSRHIQGIAFDISWKYPMRELIKAAENQKWNYIKKYSSWVHLDLGVRM